jgi:hypothetical protein
MLQRCLNPNNPNYPNYGGRGITVCERWRYGDGVLSGFECFLADMRAPPPGMSLDRINVNGDYKRSNCRWATASVQNGNRRPPKRKARRGLPSISEINRYLTALARADLLLGKARRAP